jgi:hypothetical protein
MAIAQLQKSNLASSGAVDQFLMEGMGKTVFRPFAAYNRAAKFLDVIDGALVHPRQHALPEVPGLRCFEVFLFGRHPGSYPASVLAKTV